MSDDKLAERIYQAAFDRHVLIDRTDCAALAAAARAHIGDEIASDAETYRCSRAGELGSHDWDLLDGLECAESIARGDTE